MPISNNSALRTRHLELIHARVNDELSQEFLKWLESFATQHDMSCQDLTSMLLYGASDTFAQSCDDERELCAIAEYFMDYFHQMAHAHYRANKEADAREAGQDVKDLPRQPMVEKTAAADLLGRLFNSPMRKPPTEG